MIGPAINWRDSYYYSKDRVVLTNEQVKVPGVRVLAHHVMTNALSPLAPHYHENCFEFTYSFGGAFKFRAGEKTYQISGGEIFVAFPSEVHSTDEFPLSHGEFYWLQLDISSAKSFLFLEENAALELIRKLNSIQHHVIKANLPELQNLLKTAYQLSLEESKPYLVAGYLVLFLNRLTEIPAQGYTLSKGIYQALNYIYDNIFSDISLETLAACSHLSLPQFKVRFKQEVGITPRSFVNLQKIDVAKSLLMEGYTKTDVAQQLGFNTSSYFSAVFRKYAFCSPSEWVKGQKNDKNAQRRLTDKGKYW